MWYRELIKAIRCGVLAGIVVLGFMGCGGSDEKGGRGRGGGGIEHAVTKAELDEAIQGSGKYMRAAVEKDGRVRYVISLDPEVSPRNTYNIVRHAGALFAMGEFYEEAGKDSGTLKAMVRAAGFMQRHCVKSLQSRRDLLAVWSIPKLDVVPPIFMETRHYKAKLGGAALGVVGLIALRRIDEKAVDIKTLQRLCDFIVFMQKPDGGYFDNYSPLLSGRLSDVRSLYYPGESALALVMMYEIDGNEKWLNVAAKTLAYLAKTRKHDPLTSIPADHWALIATEKIIPIWEKTNQPTTKEAVLGHAAQVCKSILNDYVGEHDDDDFVGSYISVIQGKRIADGRTTPLATRLEGLGAVYLLMKEHDAKLAERMEEALHRGVRLLIRTQEKEGNYKGAIRRAVKKMEAGSGVSRRFNDRVWEVRIDYVQHVLSAYLRYRELFGAKLKQ